MTKITLALFLLLSITFVNSSLQRLEFDQGRTNLRLLATTDGTSSGKTYAFNKTRTLNTALQVDLGTTYLKRAGIDKSIPTDMLILLYTNVTGFCNDCSEFVSYSCEENSCGANVDQPINMLSPLLPVSRGYPVTHNLNFGTDSSNWQLKSPAMVFNSTNHVRKSVEMPGINPYYIEDKTTYGFVGMGISGPAFNNFQTGDSPIFSIQVNSTGKGQLIFGRDSTQYDASRTPLKFTSDANWTLLTQNMTFGSKINSTSYYSSLIFDLQYPGIGLPSTYYSYYDGVWSTFIRQYNLTSNSSYGNTDYNYVYNGNLYDLPNLNFGMVGNMNITLPPSAYTRKVANNTYAILINSVSSVRNLTSNQDTNYTILGWPVLSQFYTVFEQPKSSSPTITLYPTYTVIEAPAATPSGGISKTVLIAGIAAAVFVLVVALSCCCKKKPSAGNKDLGVELRSTRT